MPGEALMTMKSVAPTSEAILEHIDKMMRELQALREAVLSLQPQTTGQITKQLLGSLGQAQSEEFEDHTDIYPQLFER
jgi:hypothetical protein